MSEPTTADGFIYQPGMPVYYPSSFDPVIFPEDDYEVLESDGGWLVALRADTTIYHSLHQLYGSKRNALVKRLEAEMARLSQEEAELRRLQSVLDLRRKTIVYVQDAIASLL